MPSEHFSDKLVDLNQFTGKDAAINPMFIAIHRCYLMLSILSIVVFELLSILHFKELKFTNLVVVTLGQLVIVNTVYSLDLLSHEVLEYLASAKLI